MLCNSFCRLSYFLGLLLLLLMISSEAAKTISKKEVNCQKNNLRKTRRRIGVVFDSGSEIGKQQMVAMKMGLKRFHFSSSSCFKLELLLHDSHSNYSSSASSAVDLITKGRVEAIVGAVSMQDLIVISDNQIPVGIPIVSISTEQLPLPLKIPTLIQMANKITHRIQSISSILTHFQWPRKVTLFYEITNIDHHSVNSAHRLFDSFRSVNIEIEHHLTFSSFSNQSEIFIEKELKRLRNNQRNGVFIVTQLSLELVDLLFTKAKKLNMVGNGYTWIVSDDVFDLIDFLDSASLLNKMEGVIGIRTYFDDTKQYFKRFEIKFKKIYHLNYPKDKEPTKTSIFAVRAYDAARTITRAIEKLGENLWSSDQVLVKLILESNFLGLSGMVRFKNGMLISQSSNFQIIEVVDQSYKEVVFWTPKLDFVERFVEVNEAATKLEPNVGNVAVGDLSRRLMTSSNEEKKLKFAVPAMGACQELVKVSDHLNGNYFTGFSIDVFKAVMNNINMPYSSSYDLYPFTGTYEEMIKAVSNKTYDGAVGDITILAQRFQSVDFTVAYLEADIVMVVTEKQEIWKSWWAFMDVFKLEVWLLIPTMHLFISCVIWLIERQNNEELKGLGNMLWFSVSIIFYMHREPIKNGLARLVLGSWLFGILVVTASFSASLTSMMTISLSQPSVLDVEGLKKIDAAVGCNAESFICTYLQDSLKFENNTKIKRMKTIDDYPKAFREDSIKAAFLISPHANVFLAKNCNGYTKGVSSFKLGGIGFAFQKGSALAANVSASIVELTQTNDLSQMEQSLLGSFNCSSTDKADGRGLGIGPFMGLFLTCGSIALLVLLYMGLQFMATQLGWIQKPNGGAQKTLP